MKRVPLKNTIYCCEQYTVVLSYQLKLIKMRAKSATLNDSAVPFLSRAAANLCWYYSTTIIVLMVVFNNLSNCMVSTLMSTEQPKISYQCDILLYVVELKNIGHCNTIIVVESCYLKHYKLIKI